MHGVAAGKSELPGDCVVDRRACGGIFLEQAEGRKPPEQPDFGVVFRSLSGGQ